MRELVLQDWVTLIHKSGSGPMIQTEPAYLDTSPFQDVVAWIDIRAITPSSISAGNTLDVSLETAPVKEEIFFKPLYKLSISGSPPSVGLTVANATLRNLQSGSTPPVAAWTRWKIAEANTSYDWSISFRIWLAANSACL